VLWPTELKRQLSKNSCKSGFRRWASVSFAVAKLSNIFEPRKYFNKIFRDFRRRFKTADTAAVPHPTESTLLRIQPLGHQLIKFFAAWPCRRRSHRLQPGTMMRPGLKFAKAEAIAESFINFAETKRD
jgi:hypothetical protein